MGSMMTRKCYIEDFDRGPGGWWGWISNAQGPRPLEHAPGMVISRSPWWIDYNHAPPGPAISTCFSAHSHGARSPSIIVRSVETTLL